MANFGIRRTYASQPLRRADLADDPLAQFLAWYEEAERNGCPEPNAMTLATVDAEGHPDARYVLLRGASADGFSWFTNRSSAKGRQLEATPYAALVFRWVEVHRQVRLRGPVSLVGDDESDAYWATRPRESQIGAWASAQSEPLGERDELDEAVAAITRRFAGRDVPRPPHWGGYRLQPEAYEFWQGRSDRLHDRFRYRVAPEGNWIIERLAP